MDLNELRKMSQSADSELATKIKSSVDISGFASELMNKLNAEAKTQAQRGQRKASITLDVYDYHVQQEITRICRTPAKGILVNLFKSKDCNWTEMTKYAEAFVSLLKNEINDKNIHFELNDDSRTCEIDRDGDISCTNKWWNLKATVSW